MTPALENSIESMLLVMASTLFLLLISKLSLLECADGSVSLSWVSFCKLSVDTVSKCEVSSSSKACLIWLSCEIVVTVVVAVVVVDDVSLPTSVVTVFVSTRVLVSGPDVTDVVVVVAFTTAPFVGGLRFAPFDLSDLFDSSDRDSSSAASSLALISIKCASIHAVSSPSNSFKLDKLISSPWLRARNRLVKLPLLSESCEPCCILRFSNEITCSKLSNSCRLLIEMSSCSLDANLFANKS
uniref:(northern house mosquito) hypothetical protein n=1 Tax=Culex pipiens TaxID=7175 RepID=A0A8D8NSN9_CULPI